MMTNNLKAKLKKYSLLTATSIGLSTVAQADIIYTDIDPDEVLDANNESFDLNVNGGISSSIWLQLKTAPGSNYVDVYGSVGVFYDYFITGGFDDWFIMKNFVYGSSICTNLVNSNNGFLGWKTGGSNIYEFNGVQDAYVGFQLWKNGNIHNAWLRIDVTADYQSVIVKDYAYDSRPEQCIKAGVMPIYADSCSSLLLDYIPQNGNSSDLKVSFSKPADESGINEYKVFIVKSSDTTLATLEKLMTSNYYQVFDSASNTASISLNSTLRDFKGNFLEGEQTYKFVVVSVPNNINTTNHNISNFSNAVTLQKITTQTASNIYTKDVSNFCNSSDIEICFDKATNETGIEEYRVFVVKSANAASFDISKAEAVFFPNYFSFPTGSDVCQIMYPYSKDADGDTILHESDYKIFILSKSKNSSYISSLSNSSETFKINCAIGIIEEKFSKTTLFYTNGVLNVNSNLSKLKVSVYDTHGKLLLTTNKTTTLYGFSKGVYIALLEHEGRIISKKIIVD